MTTLRLVTDQDDALTSDALSAALDELRAGHPDLADRTDADLLAMPAGELSERLRVVAERLGQEVEASSVGQDLLSLMLPDAVDIERPMDPLYRRIIGLPITIEVPGLRALLSWPDGRTLFQHVAQALAGLDDAARERITAGLDEHNEHVREDPDLYCDPFSCGWTIEQDAEGVVIGLAGVWLLRLLMPSAGRTT